jgi:hypothetical protein
VLRRDASEIPFGDLGADQALRPPYVDDTLAVFDRENGVEAVGSDEMKQPTLDDGVVAEIAVRPHVETAVVGEEVAVEP